MDRVVMLFADVLKKAIKELRKREIPLYTFAFYHDHESAAVSVCADTEANSLRSVKQSNTFYMKYFAKAVEICDLEELSQWQANVGRSLEIGASNYATWPGRNIKEFGRARVSI